MVGGSLRFFSLQKLVAMILLKVVLNATKPDSNPRRIGDRLV
jgi:hypothetical protein